MAIAAASSIVALSPQGADDRVCRAKSREIGAVGGAVATRKPKRPDPAEDVDVGGFLKALPPPEAIISP